MEITIGIYKKNDKTGAWFKQMSYVFSHEELESIALKMFTEKFGTLEGYTYVASIESSKF